MGKIYPYKATEIVSMGLEFMAHEPQKLAKDDPEYFDFTYALMRAG